MSAPAPGRVVLHTGNNDVITGRLTRNGVPFDLTGWNGEFVVRDTYVSDQSYARWPIVPDTPASAGEWHIDVTTEMVDYLGAGYFWFVVELRDEFGELTSDHTPVQGSLTIRGPASDHLEWINNLVGS